MRPGLRLLHLSVVVLWSLVSAENDSAVFTPKSMVVDACASYADLDQLNALVKPAVDDLTRTTDFFSHYRLNLFHNACPFWDDDGGICGNIGCAVETLDNEADVPEVWRASELSKLVGPLAEHPAKVVQRENPKRPLQGKLGEHVGESCVVEYDDEYDERDYCVPEDESITSKGDYVSLLRNAEQFTGYGGHSAHQIWNAIYRENCFQKSSFSHSADLGSPPSLGPAAEDFKQILKGAAVQQQRLQRPDDPFAAASASASFELDGQCLEKRVFYRVMSGMHASISAHLCWDFLNQTTGQWQPNTQCYISRLRKHPDRISNLYFNYALVTRAVAKFGPYLQSGGYTFCTGDVEEDAATRAKVLEVINRATTAPALFDESLMFVNGEGPSLKEDFRNRFRNVSRLMDCVGCDKCRLWGKIQTSGYGTALKVLFELDNASEIVPNLKRTELVALFNTYARVSESLSIIGRFNDLLAEKEAVRSVVTETEPVAIPATETVEEMKKIVRDTERTRQRKHDMGAGERFKQELLLVMQVVKLVLKSWMGFPKTMWMIFYSEATRLFQFWLGMPVQDRGWQFVVPDVNALRHDEL